MSTISFGVKCQECVFELVILSGVNFLFSSTLIIENRGCLTSRQIGTSNLKVFFRSSVSPWTTKSVDLCNHTGMNKTQNPYRLQMIQQGRDPVDAPIREVPARYRDRFATYEEYQEAIAEMLNGMWQSTRCHTTACDPLESVQIYHHEQNNFDLSSLSWNASILGWHHGTNDFIR